MANVPAENFGEPSGDGSLSFWVETHDLPDAKMTGALLQRFAVAYRAYAVALHGKRVDSRLVVRRIEVGSIEADLTAIGSAIGTLWDHRAMLAGFATHLSEAFHSLAAGIPVALPKETKALAKETVTVIENHQAGGINIINSGTINGNIFYIGQAQAAAIKEALRVTVEPIAEVEDVTDLPDSPIAQALVADTRLADLTGPQTMTAFSVGGRWYGRVEGLSEGLFPLRVPSRLEAVLANAGRYHWKGAVRRDLRGSPSAIDVESIAPV